MKPFREQVRAWLGLGPIATENPAPSPPSPYELAFAFGQAILASGKMDSPQAAVAAGWTLVIPFYEGRKLYEADIRARMMAAAHAQLGGQSFAADFDPPLSAAEARAWVAPGETGNMGEVGGLTGTMAAVTTSISLASGEPPAAVADDPPAPEPEGFPMADHQTLRNHEDQGTGHDPHADGYERQGRKGEPKP